MTQIEITIGSNGKLKHIVCTENTEPVEIIVKDYDIIDDIDYTNNININIMEDEDGKFAKRISHF